jgi:hypothetical protein
VDVDFSGTFYVHMDLDSGDSVTADLEYDDGNGYTSLASLSESSIRGSGYIKSTTFSVTLPVGSTVRMKLDLADGGSAFFGECGITYDGNNTADIGGSSATYAGNGCGTCAAASAPVTVDVAGPSVTTATTQSDTFTVSEST